MRHGEVFMFLRLFGIKMGSELRLCDPIGLTL